MMAFSANSSGSPSQVKTVLNEERKLMWNAPLEGKPALVLGPCRDFVLDPSFAIVSIILPPLTRHPKADILVSKILRFFLYPLRLLYRSPPEQDMDLRVNAKNDIIINSKAGIRALPHRPPSDLVSALRGALAFMISVTADIVGTFMDRKKMTKWFEAVTEFKAYLDLSGIGQELDEAIYKPLVRGRLMDNLKILNDCQEVMYADRCLAVSQCPAEELKEDILEGKRMMRFATAAYGTQMIKSALDREAESHHLESQAKAIAFHCDIDPNDIRILYVDDGGDMKVLRHFVAIDHKTKSVVLALRGTLSISGALVDMQGMDGDFCGGKAHKGIAEVADNVWHESGDKIAALFDAKDETAEEIKDYDFVVCGHSLGAGAACLVNIKLHLEKPLGDRKVRCFGFAPPPTYCVDPGATLKDPTAAASVQSAIDDCVAYIHDNDCVPLLSVTCIRRLATLMDTVDNKTELMWFTRRFKLFWEYEGIPEDLMDDVKNAELNGTTSTREIDGASKLEIPARVVIWMKKSFTGSTFEAFGCSPGKIADMNVFCCQDMISDHLPEQYEDALDALVDCE